MRRNIITVIFSIVASISLVLFSKFGLHLIGLRWIGWAVSCEGWLDCQGAFYFTAFMAVVIIPLIFGIFSFVSSQENWLKQAFVSFVISLFITVLSSLIFSYVLGQIETYLDVQRAIKIEGIDAINCKKPLEYRKVSFPDLKCPSDI